MELQTQLKIAMRLGFVDSCDFERAESLASEVGRMLSAMLNKLRTAPDPLNSKTLNPALRALPSPA
jgi:hypothetical protein